MSGFKWKKKIGLGEVQRLQHNTEYREERDEALDLLERVVEACGEQNSLIDIWGPIEKSGLIDRLKVKEPAVEPSVETIQNLSRRIAELERQLRHHRDSTRHIE